MGRLFGLGRRGEGAPQQHPAEGRHVPGGHGVRFGVDAPADSAAVELVLADDGVSALFEGNLFSVQQVHVCLLFER
jgi:hypothetical protein